MQQLQCLVYIRSSTNKFMVNVSVYVLFCYEHNECITNALEWISIQYLSSLACYTPAQNYHTSSGVDSDRYTIHFIRFATASVILLLHKSSVNKKFILCSYNSHFVHFCSSELRSKAEGAGASFRSNESMTQMTRSWFDVSCRKIQCVTMKYSLSY